MTTAHLTFALAGVAYAIPLERVREVVACRSVVRVPNAGDFLRGVMNLRGSVVPVFDIARRLGLGDTAVCDTTSAMLVEADIDGETTAIAGLVDEIRAVTELDPQSVTQAPEFGTPVDPRVVRGISTENDRFAYVLDLDEILAAIK